MKIIQIIKHPGQGGAEKYAYLLAKKAKEAGHEVCFIFGEKGPLVKKIEKLGIQTYFVKMRTPYDIFAIFNLAKIFRKIKPDVVHTHFMRENILAIDAKVFCSVKAIFSTVHRIEPKTKAQAFVNRFYSKYLTSFIAVSELSREYLEKEGINKYKVVVIPNGAEKSTANKDKIRLELGLKEEKIICYVGRFSKNKGQKTLINAFSAAKIKNTKLVLVGNGALLEDIKKYVKDKKFENIIFTGEKDDAFEIISASDLYVQPSTVENMPIAVLEAMLNGIPVVASNNTAHKLLLSSGEFGNLFDVGDEKSLKEQLKKVLDSEEARGKAKVAQEFAEKHYTVEKMWENTEKLYFKYL